MNKDLSLVIGNRAWKPTGGNWYLNFDDESTDLLEYNCTAETLENTLNSTPAFVVAGGVTVTQSNDDGYKVVFNKNGAQGAITGIGDALSPTSRVLVTQVAAGSESTKAVYWIQLRQTTVSVELGAWEQEDPCTASATQVKPDIWDVALSSQPKDGSLSITVDDGDPINFSVFATAEWLQETLGVGYTVSKQGDFIWRIKTDGTPMTVAIADDSNIVSFSGVQNNIYLDDLKVSEMLSGLTETMTTFEIILTEDGNSQSLLKIPCFVVGKTTE